MIHTASFTGRGALAMRSRVANVSPHSQMMYIEPFCSNAVNGIGYNDTDTNDKNNHNVLQLFQFLSEYEYTEIRKRKRTRVIAALGYPAVDRGG